MSDSWPRECYTPWFPREGNAATFVLDIIGISDDATVTVSILHKDYENDDSAETLVAAFAGVDKVGVSTERGSGIKQLVRFEVNVQGTNNYDWVHFRMLRPNWERNSATGATPVWGGVATQTIDQQDQTQHDRSKT